MGPSAGLPASIAGLGRLQRACFWRGEEAPAPVPPAALPMGPWAGSLRELGAPYDTLVLSGDLLTAAGRLETLTVMRGDLMAADSDASARFWWWCATHPPLQVLIVDLGNSPVGGAFVVALNQLRNARPALGCVLWHVGSARDC